MQVSVEESGVIERKLTISVAPEKIETEVALRLQKMSKKAHVAGFRPGKVPHSIIKQRFSPSVTSDVVNETINSSCRDAVRQEKLQYAGLVSIDSVPYEAGKALEYVATIEVFPEITTLTLEGETIEKPAVEITDEDVLNTIENIREQRAEFIDTDDKAVVEDNLVVDFEGRIEGELFDGSSVTDVSFILGSGDMPEQIDRELIGVKQGDTKIIVATLPKEYSNSEIDGKEVEFTVTVHAVQKAKLPLDDELIELCGITDGSIETLKKNIATNLQYRLDVRLRTVLHNSVLNVLHEKNKAIEVPQFLVEKEIDRAVEKMLDQWKHLVLLKDKIKRDDYAEEAKKKVIVALTMQAVIEKFNIEIDQQKVRTHITDLPMYPECSDGYAGWCRANMDVVENVEEITLEDQVIAHILETATVVQKEMPLDVFMNPL